mmetsp:Transcript_7934/g.18708  ORF Transcript_7934/g.18708 Transcript_7934/m.18708 type:complete len:202 (-) Transcript_7934:199-804(-)
MPPHKNLISPKLLDRRLLPGTTNGGDVRTPPLAQLQNSRSNASRCARNHHARPGPHPRPLNHILCRPVRARDRSQLRVTPRTVDWKHFIPRDANELGKRPIKVRSHPLVLVGSEPFGTPHSAPHQDSLADQATESRACCNYLAAAVRSLNQRKWGGPTPSTCLNLLSVVGLLIGRRLNSLGVPTQPRIDFRVVDSRSQHLE